MCLPRLWPLCSPLTPPPLRPAPRAGIHALWQSGGWRQLLASEDLAASPLMSSPPLALADMTKPGAGARRGMLDAIMSLSVPMEVLADMDAALPPVHEDQEAARALAFEFYGAQRTQLSALPAALLERVAGVWPGCGAGSFGEVLAPVAAVRPVNGGKGYDEDVVLQLRALDLYFGGGPEEGGEEAMNNAAGGM